MRNPHLLTYMYICTAQSWPLGSSLVAVLPVIILKSGQRQLALTTTMQINRFTFILTGIYSNWQLMIINVCCMYFFLESPLFRLRKQNVTRIYFVYSGCTEEEKHDKRGLSIELYMFFALSLKQKCCSNYQILDTPIWSQWNEIKIYGHAIYRNR